MAKRRRGRPAAGPRKVSGQRHLPEKRPDREGPWPARSLLIGIAILAGAVILVGFAVAGAGTGRPSPSPSSSPSSPSSVEPSASAPTPSPSASAGPSFGPPTPDALGRYPVIDGVSCDLLEHTDFHIHAHLVIRVDGESQLVPAGIGIHEDCVYWLHTHRDSGIVHVEAPADADLTLGSLFDVWGQPLTAERVAEWTAGAGQSVYAFVNGERYPGDPRTIRLKDLENIELQVGSLPLDPEPFEFPPDFQ